MKAGSNFLIVLFVLLTTTTNAQVIKEGVITFERKTNLWKKFDDERMRKMVKEENKIKIEQFKLTFNDSLSYFQYIAPDEADPMSWMTTKSSVLSNMNANKRTVFMDMWGTPLTINDSLVQRQWKITDKTRKIAGYECTRAIWQKDDTTRIYAWFTTDIAASIGPESVQGLPGAVLGLATEDGGVVYFATKVEVVKPTEAQLTPPKQKGKEFTAAALEAELRKQMEGQPYGDRVIKELFFW